MKTMLAVIATVLSLVITQTVSAKTLFLAHFDGDPWITSGGLRADYAAAGNGVPSITSGVSRATGRFGTGAYLPSNTSANVDLRFPAAGSINAERGTVDFWYKPDYDSEFVRTCGGNPRLFNVFTTSGARFMDLNLIYHSASDIRVACYTDATGPGLQFDVKIDSPYPAGTNIHVAMTWDCTNGIQLFVNGKAGAFQNRTWTATPTNFYVGASGFEWTQLDACGVIDEVRITDQVEYTGDFTPPTSEYTNPPAPVSSNLLFLAHFDGTTAHAGLDADYAKGSRAPSITTGVSRATGRFGTGAYLPSNTSANVDLKFPAAGSINADRGTVDFWYTPDYDSASVVTSGGNPRLFDVFTTVGKRFMDMYLVSSSASDVRVACYTDATGPGLQFDVKIDSPYPAGANIHVAMTWDCTNGIQLFVNGKAGAFQNRTWTATQANFYVGACGFEGAQLDACGVIDEVRITGNVEYNNNGFTPPLYPYPLPPPSGMVFMFH